MSSSLCIDSQRKLPLGLPMLQRRRFNDRRDAVGAYAQVLDPPTSICDVTYWLNHLALERNNPTMDDGIAAGPKYAAINTAGTS